MFNKTKFVEVSKELCQKGYAISPNHVGGVFTVDKPIGNRKNFFLKLLNAGRYSRKLCFLTAANEKVYLFPYKKEKPDCDNVREISADMIIKKKSKPQNFDFKIMDKEGVIENLYSVWGTIVPEQFAVEFFRVLYPELGQG